MELRQHWSLLCTQFHHRSKEPLLPVSAEGRETHSLLVYLSQGTLPGCLCQKNESLYAQTVGDRWAKEEVSLGHYDISNGNSSFSGLFPDCSEPLSNLPLWTPSTLVLEVVSVFHNSLSSFWVRIPSNLDCLCMCVCFGGVGATEGVSTQSLVYWQSLRPSGGQIQARLWSPGHLVERFQVEHGELAKY